MQIGLEADEQPWAQTSVIRKGKAKFSAFACRGV